MRRLMPKLTKSTEKKTTAKRGSGRNTRAPSKWRARVRMVGLAALASCGVSLAAVCVLSDKPAKMLADVQSDALAWSVRNGFYVADVQAVGRQNTSTADILKALQVKHSTPILTVDLQQGREQIEALPWVKTAQVERHLPNMLRVVITERVPVAISQAGKRSMLVDATGTEIVPAHAGLHQLPIITGRGAPKHIAQLLQDLSAAPEMAKRVRAAVRVGNRRWNLRLDSVAGGVEVRLPEENTAKAWQKLALLHDNHHLLQREVAMIDMRLPDRLVVRLSNGQTLPAVQFDRKGKPKRGGVSA